MCKRRTIKTGTSKKKKKLSTSNSKNKIKKKEDEILRQLQIACLLSKSKKNKIKIGPRSLNEVLLLLLSVHVVPFGVDDGRVGVRGVLGPFGLVR